MRKIMKRAHELARKMEGDYQARMALALRQAWKEEREANQMVESFEIGYALNGSLEEVKILETQTVVADGKEFELASKLERENGEVIEINFSAWEKYGKSRIYVNCPHKQIDGSFFDVKQEKVVDYSGSVWNWILNGIWENREEKEVA